MRGGWCLCGRHAVLWVCYVQTSHSVMATVLRVLEETVLRVFVSCRVGEKIVDLVRESIRIRKGEGGRLGSRGKRGDDCQIEEEGRVPPGRLGRGRMGLWGVVVKGRAKRRWQCRDMGERVIMGMRR